MARARTIAPADAAKGAAAERTFQAWLDEAAVAYMYVEQSPLTVPDPLRGQIKRPDYLVGIPGVGLVAFDVKAKTIYDEAIIFDVAEVKKLRTFARMFHLTVYFACLDPEGSPHGYWVPLDQLDELPAMRLNGTFALWLPVYEALPVSLDEPFYEAFFRAVTL
jgi:Holliday junction resolvase